MAILTGWHLQPRTGRRFSFRVLYEPISEFEVFFACCISEPSNGMFGSLERGSAVDGTVSSVPAACPWS